MLLSYCVVIRKYKVTFKGPKKGQERPIGLAKRFTPRMKPVWVPRNYKNLFALCLFSGKHLDTRKSTLRISKLVVLVGLI